MKRTEISRGLYPRAPELRRGSDLTPAEEFWVVKHGLKMTGMPAWGVTHSDELLWDVVAFLRKLPELTPDQYQALVRSAPSSHHEMMQNMETDEGHGGQPHQ
jgi:mono/diheme cytochrome c family protein